jgi:uncharacterized protein YukE
MSDMTVEILQQLRVDIRDTRDSLSARIDSLEGRMDTLEFALQGMAGHIRLLPEMHRLLRQVADTVADHDRRIDQLEHR